MKYSTPELVELGTATTLVLGGIPGFDDSLNPLREKEVAGVVMGLDD